MTSVKNKLLKQIALKADRIKQMRAKASDSSVERDVFDFFKHADEAKLVAGGKTYESAMLSSAFASFLVKLKKYDLNSTARVEWTEGSTSEVSQIRGVTITWSDSYALARNIDQVTYIDIGQMIFAV